MHDAICHHLLVDVHPWVALSSSHSSPDCSPALLLFSMMSYGMDYPFGQFGSAVLTVLPLIVLCTPSFLPGKAVREAEKSLT